MKIWLFLAKILFKDWLKSRSFIVWVWLQIIFSLFSLVLFISLFILNFICSSTLCAPIISTWLWGITAKCCEGFFTVFSYLVLHFRPVSSRVSAKSDKAEWEFSADLSRAGFDLCLGNGTSPDVKVEVPSQLWSCCSHWAKEQQSRVFVLWRESRILNCGPGL